MATTNNIQSNADKSICDGFGCLSEATSSIEEEVDGIGMIKLELCDDCVVKFREE
jgi:hypothetical protein